MKQIDINREMKLLLLLILLHNAVLVKLFVLHSYN
jgi:hypothetical protein